MKRVHKDMLRMVGEPQAIVGALVGSPTGGGDIERAIEEQPALFLEAARYRIACLRQVMRLNVQVSEREAEFVRNLRQSKAEGTKLTEADIQRAVVLDDGLRRLRARRDDADVMGRFADLMLDALRQRQMSQRILAKVADVLGVEV